MNRNLLCILSCLVAPMVSGQNLVINSLSLNGEISWSYPTNGVSGYRIEWAPDLISGRWTDLEQGVRQLAPTGATMFARVPMFYRVKALGATPTNMVYIPPGSFRMGNTFAEGGTDELPVHEVYVSGFYMDKYEVTKLKWDEVADSASDYDLLFLNGSGKDTNHPVQMVSWYEAVKWCNARSEMEGLTPCYYTDPTRTNVYRTGSLDVSNTYVRWDAEGYRLPTEAEWEKAARGGASGSRFPWPDDTIRQSRADYFATNNIGYDINSSNGFHSDYNSGGFPYTSPVDSFTPNGYGLYDMAGNVWEWCWDWQSDTYYATSPVMDPVGPDSGTLRIQRGGSWYNTASSARVANRIQNLPATETSNMGFRTVRR